MYSVHLNINYKYSVSDIAWEQKSNEPSAYISNIIVGWKSILIRLLSGARRMRGIRIFLNFANFRRGKNSGRWNHQLWKIFISLCSIAITIIPNVYFECMLLDSAKLQISISLQSFVDLLILLQYLKTYFWNSSSEYHYSSECCVRQPDRCWQIKRSSTNRKEFRTKTFQLNSKFKNQQYFSSMKIIWVRLFYTSSNPSNVHMHTNV